MSNSLALVGAPGAPLRPFWEKQAESAVKNYGEFSRPLLTDWRRTVKRSKVNGIRMANERLDKLRSLFKIGDFLVSQFEDEYLNDYCTIKARALIKLLQRWPAHMPLESAVETALPYFEHHQFNDDLYHLKKYQDACAGLALVEKVIEEQTAIGGFEGSGDISAIMNARDTAQEERDKRIPKVTGLLKRCQNEDWWRGKMRRAQNRRIEQISRELHQVVIIKSAYCSEIGKREWKRRQQLNLDMLEHTVLENDEGDRYTIADLSEFGVANPVVRRIELMVRIAGFEQHAKELGYQGWFFTITAPSKYHACSGEVRNTKFNGASPHEVQQYFCKLWARFRSKAKRITKSKPYEWEFFGFRVAEPHHDGTPHWHLLLFINPDHVTEMTEELNQLAMEVDGDEPGAEKHRFKAEKIKEGINPDTGKEYSAAGYIAKYIAKNIDGEHIDEDLYGQDAKAAAKDITAWASRNGIRQFQQVGGPKVSVWRELRRLVNLPEDQWEEDDQPLKDFVFELERIAQDSAATAWKAFCECFDGSGLSLTKTLKTLAQTIEYLDDESERLEAELTRPALNAYGEPVEKIDGLEMEVLSDEQARVLKKVTRWRQWTRVELSPEEAHEIRQQRQAEKAARAQAKEQAREAEGSAAEPPGLTFGAPAPPWTGVNNCTDANLQLFSDL